MLLRLGVLILVIVGALGFFAGTAIGCCPDPAGPEPEPLDETCTSDTGDGDGDEPNCPAPELVPEFQLCNPLDETSPITCQFADGLCVDTRYDPNTHAYVCCLFVN
jgi:hypothetical protein